MNPRAGTNTNIKIIREGVATVPVYRVILNNEDTGDYVTASSPQDAYFDVASALPLTYRDDVRLEEVESPEARPGYPVGRRTIPASTVSVMEQELYLPHSEDTRKH